MKKWFINMLESYEYRLNLKKYWKRRLAIQNARGGYLFKVLPLVDKAAGI